MEDPSSFSKYPELPTEQDLFLSKDPEELLNRYDSAEVQQIFEKSESKKKKPKILKITPSSVESPTELTAEQIAKEIVGLTIESSRSLSKSKVQPSFGLTSEFESKSSSELKPKKFFELNFDEMKTDYLDRLWKKYRRLDLVKWDITLEKPFLDYAVQQFRSLDDLISNIETYPLLSVQRLFYELEEYQADPRNAESLTSNFEVYSKFQRIFEICQRIVSTE